MSSLVDISCRQREHEPHQLTQCDVSGARIERVTIDCSEVDFSFKSDREYIALHQLRHADAETKLEGAPAHRLLDLRNRFTFVPRDARISGWSNFGPGTQSFLAMSFDPAILLEEKATTVDLSKGRPLLYFQDGDLRQTFVKIERALASPVTVDTIYVETLATLATLELLHIAEVRISVHEKTAGARLSPRQVRLITDYIHSNIQRTISLDELSSLVGLSRFHFARSFVRTVGIPPHQYAIGVRIETAKKLLVDMRLRVKDVAKMAGFASPSEFSRTFFLHTRQKPSEYRRQHGRT